MKKVFISVLCFLVGIAVGIGSVFLIFGRLGEGMRMEPNVIATDGTGDNPISRTDKLLMAARSVCRACSEKNWASVAAITDPQTGILFSPYSYINSESAKVFSPSQIESFSSDPAEYIWGLYDCTGETIDLDIDDYYSRFIFDRDYCEAPVISINRIAYSGNSLENVRDVFSDCDFVDFYFPSSEASDLDWSILRLVFCESDDGTYKLQAIIHSQWTS